MTEPKAPGALCAQCPGRDRTFVPPLPAFGNPARVRLAIVGEGPGHLEVERKEPFVGPSGRMMMHGVKHTLGLSRHEVHWTNAVLCDVRERDLPEARKCCAERLRQELAACAPEVVMPVGAIGARSALLSTRPTPILKYRGSVSQVQYNLKAGEPGALDEKRSEASDRSSPAASQPMGAWVIPTIHPAFVMRARQWGPVFETDFERVGRVMREGFTPPEESPQRKLIVAKTERELIMAVALFGGSDDIAFDVETVGLGPTHTRLVCFGLSDGTTTLIVPWSKGRDGREPWWQRPQWVAQLISNLWVTRKVITHNGPAFDHIVAARYGLVIEAWEDTLVAAHALSPELPKNLAHVVTMGIDVGAWKAWEDRTADLPRLWTYCGRDTLYTSLRWAQIKSELSLG